MHLSHLLLPKIKNIRQFQSRRETFDVRLSITSAKTKEGQNTQNPVFELLVAVGGSRSPPIDSNDIVLAAVFGMCFELFGAPAARSPLENETIILIFGYCVPH